MKKLQLFIIVILSVNFLQLFPQIKIKAVGDVMPGSYTPVKIIPKDYGKKIASYLAPMMAGADICFGNFEGCFIKDGMKPCKCKDRKRDSLNCYEFGIPLAIAPNIKNIGFNVMSLDNNHTNDYGDSAYSLSQETLNQLGIITINQSSYVFKKIKNKTVAFVSFSFDKKAFLLNDYANMSKIMKELREKSDLIFVSFHGGAEGKNAVRMPYFTTEYFLGANRGNIMEFAHRVIDEGADVVIGHGPHVLRGFELYRNKLIAYSLGNFFTYGNFNLNGPNGIACILELDINENNGNFLKGRILSTVQKKPGIPLLDPKKQAIDIIKKLSSEIDSNTKLRFDKDGIVSILSK